MFEFNKKRVKNLTILLVALFMTGCAGTSTPVKHLSSDVCLVMPEKTTREEVISFLGEPDRKMTTAEGLDLWLYLKVSKSLSRKMPLIGEKIGSENYETVTVTFAGDLVRTCLYRQFDEDEFEKFNAELP